MRLTDLNLIVDAAEYFKIDPRFLFALIKCESNFECYACRYEPNYEWLHQPELIAKKLSSTIETHIAQQRTSWGLMQVMGANLYYIGGGEHFDTWPAELVEPELNLEIGCKMLLKLKKKWRYSLDLYAAYNAGSVRKDRDGEYINKTAVDRFAKEFVSLPKTPDSIVQQLTRPPMEPFPLFP